MTSSYKSLLDNFMSRPVFSVKDRQAVREIIKNMDLIDLLPVWFRFNGKPLDISGRRPLFIPLFTKRKAKKQLWICGRQIGKTLSATARMCGSLIHIPNYRMMYVAPLAIYTHRLHHMYFRPMMKTCQIGEPLQDKDDVKNVNEKSFANGSHFHAVSCYNNAENARGIPSDDNTYDEVQSLNNDLLPAIRETLRSSEYKRETFFGTALGMENTIQILFNRTSQCEWVVKCPACNHHNIPTMDHDAIKMLKHKTGVTCGKCERPIDVSVGSYVSARPDLHDEFEGYHIPQTMIAEYVNDPENYIDIWNKLHSGEYSMAKFQQEVLGISSDQGGRPIVQADIDAASTLNIEKMTVPDLGNYATVTGGADWGGSEITSFTVGVAVGFHAARGEFHCLGAIRPTGVPADERHLVLAPFYRSFRVSSIGADGLYVGPVQNPLLSQAVGVPVGSMIYGTTKFFLVPKNNNVFILERETALFIVFTLIRTKKLLFPKGEYFKQFTKDLLAIFTEEIQLPNGTVKLRYSRYKDKADDFAHSLAYAIALCALESGIDLPKLIGLDINSSLTKGIVDEITGEEGYRNTSLLDV